jgi:hypothetical protein
MEFVWNDGGRAAAGYVGIAGDCVTRAVAIASGAAYRDVYKELGKLCEKSPRDGVATDAAARYLAERGWVRSAGWHGPFVVEDLPKGVLVVELADRDGRSGHFCTVIDGVVHDTWNPAEDDDYIVEGYWTCCSAQSGCTQPAAGPKRRISKEQELTQAEFERILKRLRALDATANNHASTEGEKHNALRMMQHLMLRHNLTREDIVNDDDVDNVQFTRIACPVNGRRACAWEKMLAWYITREVFPTVQWYTSTRGHRTFFWFYGPLADVQNSIALFRELLLTIATAAHLQYGSHVRGSGASYAEGYVSGLPRSSSASEEKQEEVLSQRSLICARTVAVHSAADRWIELECNVKLTKGSRAGRYQYDHAAAGRGKLHGSKHQFNVPGAPPRLTS